MTPSTIAHYRITAKLGEGGMGEVWRATDTKLNRDVAIKILPDAFAQDAGRMARFAREAQVLAALNHPNIAVIHGVEERALVMELVPGPTLAERIAQGAIPLDEALAIAKQIAEALEYAHERGIVHRDLKPANIKITPEGRVKVLDFGLAKAMTGEVVAADPASSPTLTMRAGASAAGMILGTAAYMSPEQARGQNVDRRADIWAFGVVLFEMLTGRTLFAGATVSDTLAAVLKTDVDVSPIAEPVRSVVEKCLRKDARRRWRDIGDVRLALEEGALVACPAQPRRSVLPWAITAGALTIAAAGWLLFWRAARPVDHPLTRLSVDLGPTAMTGLNLTAAISPDGRRLVFAARGPDGKQQLSTRLLDQTQPTLLPGTVGGRDPFFSPDGQWIGFFAGGELKKISVQGGSPVTLYSSYIAQGASWGQDENIIAAMEPQGPLYRIPAAGGARGLLTKFGPGELTHRWPQVVPGSGAVIFTASPSNAGMENANIEAVSLKTGQAKILQRGGYSGRYLPSGHLVYVHQGVLFGVKFDAERLEVRGTPVPLLDDVAASPVTGGGQFDFSATGTFVYASGKSAAQAWQVTWLDGSGKMQPLVAVPGAYVYPRLSPDGRKLAVVVSGDIYVHDLGRDTATRLTFSGDANAPVWAPDGKHLVFQSISQGRRISWVRSDGVGDPQLLREQANNLLVPWSFSRAGRLAYLNRDPETGIDIWTLPLDLTDPDHPKPGKPEPFLRTSKDETVPRFSADSRWIAYRSNESGNDEIYVRPFPAANGGRWQISVGGGFYAFWSNNGHELFYETADFRIMVVDYKVEGASFVHGKPRLWSDKQLFYPGTMNLDLAPDGKRFIVLTQPENARQEKNSVQVVFLLNFFDELRRRIP
jgi:serine/threonine-protein kinase